MATDNVLKKWGDPGTLYQKETRKYWDRTYVYGIKDNGTIGGMSTATDDFYAYCNELTLGGVSKGTWNAKRKDGYYSTRPFTGVAQKTAPPISGDSTFSKAT